MTDRELRRLGRRDLLELLVALGHERDALKAELENRQLKIDRAGSIAEAALQVNGVFESAQAAAELYLDNVRERTERVEEICAQREAAAQADAERIRREAEEVAQALLAETQHKCAAMESEAKRKANAYWHQVQERLDAFTREHEELKRLHAEERKT